MKNKNKVIYNKKKYLLYWERNEKKQTKKTNQLYINGFSKNKTNLRQNNNNKH